MPLHTYDGCTALNQIRQFGAGSREDKGLSHRWAKNSSRKHTTEQGDPVSTDAYELGTPIMQLTDE